MIITNDSCKTILQTKKKNKSKYTKKKELNNRELEAVYNGTGNVSEYFRAY